MGLLDKLFDPGKKYRDAAGNYANQGVIKGFNFSGPGGIGGNFNFAGGRGRGSSDLGAFGPVFEQLLAQGAGGIGGGGVTDELRGLAGGTIDRLGSMNVDQISGQQDYDTLGGIMQSSASLAQKDPFELGATISDKLRMLSERKNQRLVNKMFDRLQSTGNLTSSAGIQRAGDMERNLFEQGLQFDLAGLEAGQGMIRDAFGRVMGAGQAREGIAGRTFGESFAMEQLGGNRAMQQFGVGSQLFGMDEESRRLASQMGLANIQAAMGVQQIPLNQLMAFANMTGLASGSQFNAASVMQGNAATAKSPWLEALNAVGQFAGNISGFKMPGS